MTLHDEIAEQPEIAARFLATQSEPIDAIAAGLRARGVRRVVVAARGTSDHAALYAQYVLGIRHRWSVGLGTPSIVSLYGVAPDLEDTLVIGISQSGASPGESVWDARLGLYAGSVGLCRNKSADHAPMDSHGRCGQVFACSSANSSTAGVCLSLAVMTLSP